MQLVVNGLPGNRKFKHLFGCYVSGFRPWKHCDACFEAKRAMAIHPGMVDGTYELRDDLELFYLCGVGQPDHKTTVEGDKRRATNVHLAVRPRKGSTAAIGSVYGVSFVIHDAQAIPIVPIPDGFQNLPQKHSRCKNFQFGYQMFEADVVGDAAPHEVVRTPRSL